VFNDRKISTGLWPPTLPVLSVCNFYLWESLKGEMYGNTPHTAEALPNEVRDVIAPVSADNLHHVSQGFLSKM
jgi:hypothetical protein